jgi:uncharacterized protein YecE (DUF72 family)
MVYRVLGIFRTRLEEVTRKWRKMNNEEFIFLIKHFFIQISGDARGKECAKEVYIKLVIKP